ncbi:hypothetical protein B0H17DRAFT_956444, partial [Mycena rosella]
MKPGSRTKLEIRGCLRRDGTCSARFPRDIIQNTVVDPEDGAIHMKKREAMINCISPDLTYCLRCNTDVTSLLSGTSIKAVVAYISDYVTKASLKIYHIFRAVKDVLNRNTENMGSSAEGKENTRVLVMQMVNSLSSKLQIGSPMASLYLLGNPDRYTNVVFKPFWWISYVSEVKRVWPTAEGNGSQPREVLPSKKGDDIVGVTPVDDYTFRSPEFENTSLFDYFQMANRVKRTKRQYNDFMESLRNRDPDVMMDVQAVGPDDDWLVDDGDQTAKVETLEDPSDAVSIHPFQEGHELYETHYIRCDRRNLDKAVPNFLGGALPRKDLSDREFNCCTMMTLFKPWRSGSDLKNTVDNWDETFREYEFSEKALTLMKNFNVKYECNDARDDFASQDRQRSRPMPMFSRWRDAEEVEDSDGGDLMGYDEDDYDPPA